MAYVTIPKDLSRIQSKVLFGLTKRQVICFGAAAVIGVPLFFLSRGALGTTTAALCYQTNNLYSALVRQYELEQEVRKIAGKNGKTRKNGKAQA